MDIIGEIDNRQKEIARLADELAKTRTAAAQLTERITYLRGQVDMLRQIGEATQGNAGQSADAQQEQAASSPPPARPPLA